MKNKALFKPAMVTGVVGLVIIFSVIFSGVSSPHIFFTIATPLGLLLIFASVILWFVAWLFYVSNAVKNKQYTAAIFVAALGLLIIIKELFRIL